MNLCIITPELVDPIKGGVYRVCSLLKNSIEARGKKVINCHFGGTAYESSKKVARETYYIEGASFEEKLQNFCAITRSYNIDIVWNHSHVWEHHELCCRLRDMIGCKLVSVIHTDPLSSIKSMVDVRDYYFVNKMWWSWILSLIKYFPGLYLRYKRVRFVMKSKYDESDAIVLLSSGYKKSVTKLLGSKNTSKLHVIPNPILAASDVCIEKRNNRVLFVGRLVWQKRLDRVLQVWNIIEPRFDNWELLIVGDGEMKKLYERLAKTYRLKQVRFLGECDSSALYKTADIVCLSSTFEGLPMVILEAQINGCVPVLYNSFSAAEDIVDDEKSGYLISPFDKKMYANRLISLMEDRCLRARMSAASRIKAQQFDIDIIVNKWLIFFRELY